MSLIAPRPKRAFEPEQEVSACAALTSPGAKRARCESGSTRCAQAPAGLSRSSLAVLASLFPNMEEQTLVAVLSDCGDNIDQAIKVLGQLRLVAEDAGPSTGPSSGGQGTPAQGVGTPQRCDEEQQVHQAAEGEQVPSTSGPQTPEEWVDALVGEMAVATDVNNARARAANVLGEFEKWAAVHRQGDTEKTALQAKLNDVLRENHILKRAVQIQNAKLHEKSAAEAEVGQLKTLLGQYQEQVRALEVSNYSLAMHLQQATGGSALGNSRPPDVY